MYTSEMETLYVNPNRLQPIYAYTINFITKGRAASAIEVTVRDKRKFEKHCSRVRHTRLELQYIPP